MQVPRVLGGVSTAPMWQYIAVHTERFVGWFQKWRGDMSSLVARSSRMSLGATSKSV